jgi:MFS superfamily sulfate permease-like transporter
VWGLLDTGTLRSLLQVSRFEFGLSLLTTVGVLTIGVLPGVVLAILLALLHVLQKIYQPQEAILGQVPGLDGYNDIRLFPNAQTVPGIIIYRFESPLLFFNADLFKSRMHALVEAADATHTLVLSLEGVTQMDVTGLHALFDVHAELKRKGIRLLLARPKRYMRKYAETARAVDKIGRENIFFSIRSAVKSALVEQAAAQNGQPSAG